MHGTLTSRTLIAILAAALLALPVGVAPAGATPHATPNHLDDQVVQHLQSSPETRLIPVIVEGPADPTPAGRAQLAENRMRQIGGQIVGRSRLLGASVALLSPAQLRALASDPAIGRIHYDAEVVAAATSDNSPGTATPVTFDQTIGATTAWASGITGKGVTVAVLDSGIDNTTSAFGNRIKARADLVDPLHPVQGDPGGHGTHIAGVIAASRDFASPGVAPDASLVSVRVLDANGQSRLSTVVAGLEWTIAHKDALGIQVVVMALGAPPAASYRDDVLAAAAEMAWHDGIVVVTAAGNAGPKAGTITSPGIDPLVITTGAADEAGTAGYSDDVIPSWSAEGPTADRIAKPDLVAPGRKIVSVRVPGSTLDRLLPTHIEGPQTFRLSGTSQSAAVVGASVALLLQQRRDLNPDAVKAILTSSSNRLPGAPASMQGSGELSVARALQTPGPAHTAQKVRPADAFLRLLLQIGRPALAQAMPARWKTVGWDTVGWDTVGWDMVVWD